MFRGRFLDAFHFGRLKGCSVRPVWAVIATSGLGSAVAYYYTGTHPPTTPYSCPSARRLRNALQSASATIRTRQPCYNETVLLGGDAKAIKTILPSRPDPASNVSPLKTSTGQCKQRVYFWGDRINLPYGFDGTQLDRSRSNLLPKPRDSHSKATPTLDEQQPSLQGHFGPHLSQWFDDHQYGWKDLALGSHFGAAVTEKGDLYLWGSFIPPVVLGPASILPTRPENDPSSSSSSNKKQKETPEISIVLHQSVATLPTERRTPTYAEELCIREAENYRIFVGPVKIPLAFAVKEAKAGANKLFVLSTKGQVYCLDDLIGMLHWLAFDHYLVPVPPVYNPYNTQHSVVVDMKLPTSIKSSYQKSRPPSLTSLLPVGYADSPVDALQKNTSKVLSLKIDSESSEQSSNQSSTNIPQRTNEDKNNNGHDHTIEGAHVITPVPSVASPASTDPLVDKHTDDDPVLFLLQDDGTLIIPQKPSSLDLAKPTDAIAPDTEHRDAFLDEILYRPITWLERPTFYLLSQLPQPGLLWGKGVKTIVAGYDHMCCLTYTGELFCMGDNTHGQCGVDPGIVGQSVVGLARVRHPLGTSQRERITSVVCGDHHTVFQDAEGVIYTFGSDQQLQLGHGDTRQNVGYKLKPSSAASLEWNKDHSAPIQSVVEYGILKKRELFTPTTIMPPITLQQSIYGPADKLICGAESTCLRFITSPLWLSNIALTTDVYCCGNNLWGQCGSNEALSQQPFHRVKLPMQFHTLRMSCGKAHCVAFLSDGELYGWGDNRLGQAGLKKPRKITLPTRIRLERRTKEQRLLHQALPTNRPLDTVKDAVSTTAEALHARGLISDFKDETTQLDVIKEEQADKLKEVDKFEEAPLKPEISSQPSERISKPVYRVSPKYGGDVIVVECRFNSTGIIRNAPEEKEVTYHET